MQFNQFQQYPPQFQQNQFQPQQTQNGINWVNGPQGVNEWQLPYNSNVLLMDSENEGRFYIKVRDGAGMCNVRVFAYKEITEQPKPQVDMSQYVTKAELIELLGGINNGKQPVSTNDGKRHESKVTANATNG